MKISEALLLRKQLEKKVQQLEPLKLEGEKGIFETKVDRIKINEEIDEARLKISKINISELTAEYDKYASALRKLDASIQKANWSFDVDFKEGENPFNKVKDTSIKEDCGTPKV